jgi:molybdopterin converting factor small subunit
LVIHIKLHTIAQIQSENGLLANLDLVVPEGSPLSLVLEQLPVNIPIEHLLFVINHRLCEPEILLYEDDTVEIIPALSGG